MDTINSYLKTRKAAGLWRMLKPHEKRAGGMISIEGKEYVDLSSNDYLGLSHHPALITAAQKSVACHGVGASASRLLSGSHALFSMLEEKTAAFKLKEAALIFNTGYQANIAMIPALCGERNIVFIDKLAHASIIDGSMLSGAKIVRFRHNDVLHLKVLLEKYRTKYAQALIITETVFSMDGDIAPLSALVALKKAYACMLMVDEAHATGIFGAEGSGVVEQCGLSDDVDIIMGTFSKALGSFGAYAATSQLLKDYFINAARGFIYSTALPPAVIAVNLRGLDIIRDEPERRTLLLKNACWFRQQLRDAGCAVRGDSQIVPVIIGDNDKAVKTAQSLRDAGYWVTAIRPPTVPQGQARLRFSITYEHAREDLQGVIEALSQRSNIKNTD